MDHYSAKELDIEMEQAVRYLDETPFYGKKNEIGTVRIYLDRLGHPEKGMKIIHIAGTNGKGSTASKIASCLQEAGLRTGLFISPHLSDIRERMSVDGEMISKEEFLSLYRTVRSECERAAKEGIPGLLYFEFLFLMAMLWFAGQRPDYVVLETGLGGRLDATNCLDDKVLTIITRIGLDHTQILGETLDAIAREKAGILRKGCPAVFLTEPEEAYASIKRAAQETGAPVTEVSRDMWEVHSADENGIDFSLHTLYDKTLRILIPDRALYQCENAALAAVGFEILMHGKGYDCGEIIRAGIAKSFWPCRMEEILPHVFIDGAHNPDGVRAFLESVGQIAAKERESGDRKRILLFSCVRDKDYGRELSMISDSGLFSEIAAVPMSGARALSADELRQILRRYFADSRIHTAASVRDAVNRFIFNRDKETDIFAVGSLYLAGALRELILKRQQDG